MRQKRLVQLNQKDRVKLTETEKAKILENMRKMYKGDTPARYNKGINSRWYVIAAFVVGVILGMLAAQL